MNNSRSIAILTHAPFGSLGDPSAASKLIKRIKEEYGETIEITMVLIVENQHKSMAMDLFKEVNKGITLITMPKFDLQYKDKNISLDAVLKKADGILFFPTFHHFDEKTDIPSIMDYYKPTFIATEYDLYVGNTEAQKKKIGTFSSRTLQMRTGLGKDKLGIFCSLEQGSSNNRKSLSQINSASDAEFKKLLLEGDDPKNYHDTHQLFFGYFNKDNGEVKGHKANPIMFIESCLHLASPEKNTIDFVLPLSLATNPLKSIDELTAYFEKHPNLIEGYRFEIWIKNQEGKMECLKVGGEGKKLIRVINGYPFTPNTMDKLMKASDEFVMMTGDQSLSEAISHGKIFIYQTMYWKEELWESLKNTVAQHLSQQSKLYQFLAMQDKNSSTSLDEFKAFLKANKKELEEEAIKLRDHILDDKNLFIKLPPHLRNFLFNPEEYITECLNKHNEPLSYGFNTYVSQKHRCYFHNNHKATQ